MGVAVCRSSVPSCTSSHLQPEDRRTRIITGRHLKIDRQSEAHRGGGMVSVSDTVSDGHWAGGCASRGSGSQTSHSGRKAHPDTCPCVLFPSQVFLKRAMWRRLTHSLTSPQSVAACAISLYRFPRATFPLVRSPVCTWPQSLPFALGRFIVLLAVTISV